MMMIIIRNIISEIDYKIQHKRNCRNKKCRKLKLSTENRN